MSVDIQYSINLMWINKNPCSDYLCVDEEKTNAFMEYSSKWQTKNPLANVNIWYDESNCTKTAHEKAIILLEKLKKENPQLQSMKIIPLGSIPFVKENPDLFSHQMPLYFRIDLLKLVICAYQASQPTNPFAIFTDALSIKPIKKEKLFNSSDLENLNKNRILLNKNIAEENQFIQVRGDKCTLAILKHVINLISLRAITMLKANNNVRNNEMPRLYTSPFFSTLYEIPFLRSITESGIRLKVNKRMRCEESDEWVDYEYSRDGYRCFGDLFLSRSQLPLITASNERGCVARSTMLKLFDSQTNAFLPNRDNEMSTHSAVKAIRGGGAHSDVVSETLEPKDKSSGFKCKYWEEITPQEDTFFPSMINR